MLRSTSSSTLLRQSTRYARQYKHLLLRSQSSSGGGGTFGKTDRKEQADSSATANLAEVPKSRVRGEGGLLQRFVVTAEVTVSKIFPAGFGWQTASVLADGMGMQSDTWNFALTTGAGDAIGYVVYLYAY